MKIAVICFQIWLLLAKLKRNCKQKYLLNVAIKRKDSVITAWPLSWMQLCVEKNLYNKGGDALSCLHAAVSKGLKCIWRLESLGTAVCICSQQMVIHSWPMSLGIEAHGQDADFVNYFIANKQNVRPFWGGIFMEKWHYMNALITGELYIIMFSGHYSFTFFWAVWRNAICHTEYKVWSVKLCSNWCAKRVFLYSLKRLAFHQNAQNIMKL